jgi:hypothetical protein
MNILFTVCNISCKHLTCSRAIDIFQILCYPTEVVYGEYLRLEMSLTLTFWMDTEAFLHGSKTAEA